MSNLLNEYKADNPNDKRGDSEIVLAVGKEFHAKGVRFDDAEFETEFNRLRDLELPSLGETARRRLGSGILSVKSTIQGAGVLGLDVLGFDNARDELAQNVRKTEERMALKNKNLQTDFTTANTFDQFMNALAGGAGEVAPSVLESIATGLIGAGVGTVASPTGPVGGAVAGFFGKKFVKNSIKKRISKFVKADLENRAGKKRAAQIIEEVASEAVKNGNGKEAYQTAISLLGKREYGGYSADIAKKALGNNAAAWGSKFAIADSIVQNTGEIYNNITREGFDTDKFARIGSALGGGVVAGALDAILPKVALGRIFKGFDTSDVAKATEDALIKAAGDEENALRFLRVAFGNIKRRNDEVVKALGGKRVSAKSIGEGFARNLPQDAALEALTESLQTLVGEVAHTFADPTYEIDHRMLWRDMVNSAALGALGGGQTTALSSLIEGGGMVKRNRDIDEQVQDLNLQTIEAEESMNKISKFDADTTPFKVMQSIWNHSNPNVLDEDLVIMHGANEPEEAVVGRRMNRARQELVSYLDGWQSRKTEDGEDDLARLVGQTIGVKVTVDRNGDKLVGADPIEEQEKISSVERASPSFVDAKGKADVASFQAFQGDMAERLRAGETVTLYKFFGASQDERYRSQQWDLSLDDDGNTVMELVKHRFSMDDELAEPKPAQATKFSGFDEAEIARAEELANLSQLNKDENDELAQLAEGVGIFLGKGEKSGSDAAQKLLKDKVNGFIRNQIESPEMAIDHTKGGARLFGRKEMASLRGNRRNGMGYEFEFHKQPDVETHEANQEAAANAYTKAVEILTTFTQRDFDEFDASADRFLQIIGKPEVEEIKLIRMSMMRMNNLLANRREEEAKRMQEDIENRAADGDDSLSFDKVDRAQELFDILARKEIGEIDHIIKAIEELTDTKWDGEKFESTGEVGAYGMDRALLNGFITDAEIVKFEEQIRLAKIDFPNELSGAVLFRGKTLEFDSRIDKAIWMASHGTRKVKEIAREYLFRLRKNNIKHEEIGEFVNPAFMLDRVSSMQLYVGKQIRENKDIDVIKIPATEFDLEPLVPTEAPSLGRERAKKIKKRTAVAQNKKKQIEKGRLKKRKTKKKDKDFVEGVDPEVFDDDVKDPEDADGDVVLPDDQKVRGKTTTTIVWKGKLKKKDGTEITLRELIDSINKAPDVNAQLAVIDEVSDDGIRAAYFLMFKEALEFGENRFEANDNFLDRLKLFKEATVSVDENEVQYVDGDGVAVNPLDEHHPDYYYINAGDGTRGLPFNKEDIIALTNYTRLGNQHFPSSLEEKNEELNTEAEETLGELERVYRQAIAIDETEAEDEEGGNVVEIDPNEAADILMQELGEISDSNKVRASVVEILSKKFNITGSKDIAKFLETANERYFEVAPLRGSNFEEATINIFVKRYTNHRFVHNNLDALNRKEVTADDVSFSPVNTLLTGTRKERLVQAMIVFNHSLPHWQQHATDFTTLSEAELDEQVREHFSKAAQAANQKLLSRSSKKTTDLMTRTLYALRDKETGAIYLAAARVTPEVKKLADGTRSRTRKVMVDDPKGYGKPLVNGNPLRRSWQGGERGKGVREDYDLVGVIKYAWRDKDNAPAFTEKLLKMSEHQFLDFTKGKEIQHIHEKPERIVITLDDFLDAQKAATGGLSLVTRRQATLFVARVESRSLKADLIALINEVKADTRLARQEAKVKKDLLDVFGQQYMLLEDEAFKEQLVENVKRDMPEIADLVDLKIASLLEEDADVAESLREEIRLRLDTLAEVEALMELENEILKVDQELARLTAEISLLPANVRREGEQIIKDIQNRESKELPPLSLNEEIAVPDIDTDDIPDEKFGYHSRTDMAAFHIEDEEISILWDYAERNGGFTNNAKKGMFSRPMTLMKLFVELKDNVSDAAFVIRNMIRANIVLIENMQEAFGPKYESEEEQLKAIRTGLNPNDERLITEFEKQFFEILQNAYEKAKSEEENAGQDIFRQQLREAFRGQDDPAVMAGRNGLRGEGEGDGEDNAGNGENGDVTPNGDDNGIANGGLLPTGEGEASFGGFRIDELARPSKFSHYLALSTKISEDQFKQIAEYAIANGFEPPRLRPETVAAWEELQNRIGDTMNRLFSPDFTFTGMGYTINNAKLDRETKYAAEALARSIKKFQDLPPMEALAGIADTVRSINEEISPDPVDVLVKEFNLDAEWESVFRNFFNQISIMSSGLSDTLKIRVLNDEFIPKTEKKATGAFVVDKSESIGAILNQFTSGTIYLDKAMITRATKRGNQFTKNRKVTVEEVLFATFIHEIGHFAEASVIGHFETRRLFNKLTDDDRAKVYQFWRRNDGAVTLAQAKQEVSRLDDRGLERLRKEWVAFNFFAVADENGDIARAFAKTSMDGLTESESTSLLSKLSALWKAMVDALKEALGLIEVFRIEGSEADQQLADIIKELLDEAKRALELRAENMHVGERGLGARLRREGERLRFSRDMEDSRNLAASFPNMYQEESSFGGIHKNRPRSRTVNPHLLQRFVKIVSYDDEKKEEKLSYNTIEPEDGERLAPDGTIEFVKKGEYTIDGNALGPSQILALNLAIYNYVNDRRGIFIADNMGVGKTIEQLIIGDYLVSNFDIDVLQVAKKEDHVYMAFAGDAKKVKRNGSSIRFLPLTSVKNGKHKWTPKSGGSKDGIQGDRFQQTQAMYQMYFPDRPRPKGVEIGGLTGNDWMSGNLSKVIKDINDYINDPRNLSDLDKRRIIWYSPKIDKMKDSDGTSVVSKKLGAAIFDESQVISNPSSLKGSTTSIADTFWNLRAEFRVFATGTITDKPLASILYFADLLGSRSQVKTEKDRQKIREANAEFYEYKFSGNVTYDELAASLEIKTGKPNTGYGVGEVRGHEGTLADLLRRNGRTSYARGAKNGGTISGSVVKNILNSLLAADLITRKQYTTAYEGKVSTKVQRRIKGVSSDFKQRVEDAKARGEDADIWAGGVEDEIDGGRHTESTETTIEEATSIFGEGALIIEAVKEEISDGLSLTALLERSQKLNYSSSVRETRTQMLNLREELSEKGQFLRRQYPFWGTINTNNDWTLSDTALGGIKAINRVHNFLSTKMNTLKGGYMMEVELEKWMELQKVDAVWAKMLEVLGFDSKGNRVNDGGRAVIASAFKVIERAEDGSPIVKNGKIQGGLRLQAFNEGLTQGEKLGLPERLGGKIVKVNGMTRFVPEMGGKYRVEVEGETATAGIFAKGVTFTSFGDGSSHQPPQKMIGLQFSKNGEKFSIRGQRGDKAPPHNAPDKTIWTRQTGTDQLGATTEFMTREEVVAVIGERVVSMIESDPIDETSNIQDKISDAMGRSGTAGKEVTVGYEERKELLVTPTMLDEIQRRLKTDMPSIKFAVLGPDEPTVAVEKAFLAGEIDVLLTTFKSGSTGINLDNRLQPKDGAYGARPVTLITAMMPPTAVEFEQLVYRISRRISTSPAHVEVFLSPDMPDDIRAMNFTQDKLQNLFFLTSGDTTSKLMDAPEADPLKKELLKDFVDAHKGNVTARESIIESLGLEPDGVTEVDIKTGQWVNDGDISFSSGTAVAMASDLESNKAITRRRLQESASLNDEKTGASTTIFDYFGKDAFKDIGENIEVVQRHAHAIREKRLLDQFEHLFHPIELTHDGYDAEYGDEYSRAHAKLKKLSRLIVNGGIPSFPYVNFNKAIGLDTKVHPENYAKKGIGNAKQVGPFTVNIFRDSEDHTIDWKVITAKSVLDVEEIIRNQMIQNAGGMPTEVIGYHKVVSPATKKDYLAGEIMGFDLGVSVLVKQKHMKEALEEDFIGQKVMLEAEGLHLYSPEQIEKKLDRILEQLDMKLTPYERKGVYPDGYTAFVGGNFVEVVEASFVVDEDTDSGTDVTTLRISNIVSMPEWRYANQSGAGDFAYQLPKPPTVKEAIKHLNKQKETKRKFRERRVEFDKALEALADELMNETLKAVKSGGKLPAIVTTGVASYQGVTRDESLLNRARLSIPPALLTKEESEFMEMSLKAKELIDAVDGKKIGDTKPQEIKNFKKGLKLQKDALSILDKKADKLGYMKLWHGGKRDPSEFRSFRTKKGTGYLPQRTKAEAWFSPEESFSRHFDEGFLKEIYVKKSNYFDFENELHIENLINHRAESIADSIDVDELAKAYKKYSREVKGFLSKLFDETPYKSEVKRYIDGSSPSELLELLGDHVPEVLSERIEAFLEPLGLNDGPKKKNDIITKKLKYAKSVISKIKKRTGLKKMFYEEDFMDWNSEPFIKIGDMITPESIVAMVTMGYDEFKVPVFVGIEGKILVRLNDPSQTDYGSTLSVGEAPYEPPKSEIVFVTQKQATAFQKISERFVKKINSSNGKYLYSKRVSRSKGEEEIDIFGMRMIFKDKPNRDALDNSVKGEEFVRLYLREGVESQVSEDISGDDYVQRLDDNWSAIENIYSDDLAELGYHGYWELEQYESAGQISKNLAVFPKKITGKALIKAREILTEDPSGFLIPLEDRFREDIDDVSFSSGGDVLSKGDELTREFLDAIDESVEVEMNSQVQRMHNNTKNYVSKEHPYEIAHAVWKTLEGNMDELHKYSITEEKYEGGLEEFIEEFSRIMLHAKKNDGHVTPTEVIDSLAAAPFAFNKIDKIGDIASEDTRHHALVQHSSLLSRSWMHLLRKIEVAAEDIEQETVLIKGKKDKNGKTVVKGLEEKQEELLDSLENAHALELQLKSDIKRLIKDLRDTAKVGGTGIRSVGDGMAQLIWQLDKRKNIDEKIRNKFAREAEQFANNLLKNRLDLFDLLDLINDAEIDPEVDMKLFKNQLQNSQYQRLRDVASNDSHVVLIAALARSSDEIFAKMALRKKPELRKALKEALDREDTELAYDIEAQRELAQKINTRVSNAKKIGKIVVRNSTMTRKLNSARKRVEKMERTIRVGVKIADQYARILEINWVAHGGTIKQNLYTGKLVFAPPSATATREEILDINNMHKFDYLTSTGIDWRVLKNKQDMWLKSEKNKTANPFLWNQIKSQNKMLTKKAFDNEFYKVKTFASWMYTSLSKQSKQIGVPQSESMVRMITHMQSFIEAFKNESMFLGRESEMARFDLIAQIEIGWGLMNINDFRDIIDSPAKKYLEQKDATIRGAWDSIVVANPALAPHLKGAFPKFERYMKSEIKVFDFLKQAAAKMGLHVSDNRIYVPDWSLDVNEVADDKFFRAKLDNEISKKRKGKINGVHAIKGTNYLVTKVNGRYVVLVPIERSHFSLGTATFQIGSNLDHLKAMMVAMREVAGGRDSAWADRMLTQVDRYEENEDLKTSDRVSTHFNDLFNEEINELFLVPLIRMTKQNVFPAAAREDAIDAWEESNKTYVDFMERLWTKVKGDAAMTKREWIAESGKSLATYHRAYVRDYHNASQVFATNPNRLTVQRSGLDARKRTSYPSEWQRYKYGGIAENLSAIGHLAYNAALGKDGENFFRAIEEGKSTLKDLSTQLETARKHVIGLPKKQAKAKLEEMMGGKAKLAVAEKAKKFEATFDEINSNVRNIFSSELGVFKDLSTITEGITFMVLGTLNGPRSALTQFNDLYLSAGRTGFSLESAKTIAQRTAATLEGMFGSTMAGIGLEFGQNNEYRKLAKQVMGIEMDVGTEMLVQFNGLIKDMGLGEQLRATDKDRIEADGSPIKEWLAKYGFAGEPLKKALKVINGSFTKGFSRVDRDKALYETFNMWAPFNWSIKHLNRSVIMVAAKRFDILAMSATDYLKRNIGNTSVFVDGNPDNGFAEGFSFEDVKKEMDVGGLRKLIGMTSLGAFGVEIINQQEMAYDYYAHEVLMKRVGTTLEQVALDNLRESDERYTDEDGKTRPYTLEQYRMITSTVSGDFTGDANQLTTRTPKAGMTEKLTHPLIGWGLNRSQDFAQIPKSKDHEITIKSVLSGMVTIGIGLLPMVMAFSLFRDWFDEVVMGKKSDLKPLTSDDWVVNVIERFTREGTMGTTGELLNLLANSAGGGGGDVRTLSLDQRIFVANSFRNIMQVGSNLINQQGEMTYSSVYRPFVQNLGGNGALQWMQILGENLGWDNAEVRHNSRANVTNWLRTSGFVAGLEPRQFSGTTRSTPMTPWVTQMMLASFKDDLAGFNMAEKRAVKMAIAFNDETAEEAKDRVRRSFNSRHPLKTAFRISPSVKDVSKLMSIMSERGRQDTRDALNLYNKYNVKMGNKAYLGSLPRGGAKASVRASVRASIRLGI